jgi:head-tail adaptor
MNRAFRRRKSYNPFWVFVVIPLVGTLFSGLMINHGVHAYLQGKATEAWIRTEGQIIHAEIKSHNWRTRTRGSGGVSVSRIWITYRYNVNGLENQQRVSTFSSEGDQKENEKRLKPLLEIYTDSKVIPVFYNPVNVKESVLQRGGPPLWDIPTLVGIGILAASWTASLLIWKVIQSLVD